VKVDTARSCLIWGSLGITALQGGFLFVAPSLNIGLKSPQNLDVLQIVAPVFFGYLGAAAAFIFREPPPDLPVNERYLGPLAIGPLVIYILFLVLIFGRLRLL